MILIITYRDGSVSKRSADKPSWIVFGMQTKVDKIEIIEGVMKDNELSFEKNP